MKTSLFHHIQSKVSISEIDFEQFYNSFSRKVLRKNEILVSENSHNDKLYFIEKGIMYSYKTLEDGNIQVVQFAKENFWITDLSSFFENTLTHFSIKALEDTELIYIDKQQYEMFCMENKILSIYFRKMVQTAYSYTLQRLSDFYTTNAEYKYNRFISHSFEFSQRVPQYLIASYLGILPSSLSRIRNKKIEK